LITGRNIICVASNWFCDPTSKHHVMKLLARRNHVVWVNHHGSRRPTASTADAVSIAGKLRQIVQGPRRVAENMTVLTPLVFPLPGNPAAIAINRRLLAWQIRRVLQGLPRRPVQLWSFAPDVDYLAGQFNEERLVYYCVDEFSEFTGYDRQSILDAEARLARQADLVVTTSLALFESKRRLNPRCELVPHGVDAEHFARAGDPKLPVPSELRSLPRPILGFWGLIQDWVDLGLLGDLADARPDWSLLLIGEPRTDLKPLRGRTNVHLFGRRAYAELPSYAKGFDVGLIPFRLGSLTRAVNPIKLREYLAAGLPVVSSRLPEVEAYRRWVEVADDLTGWLAAIERALASRGMEADAARREAVRSESWEATVERLSRLVCEIHRRAPMPATIRHWTFRTRAADRRPSTGLPTSRRLGYHGSGGDGCVESSGVATQPAWAPVPSEADPPSATG